MDISAPQLERILEAVQWTPSWANTQCWEVIVVQDPNRKTALQDTLPPKGNPARTAIVAAPVVIALCAKLEASGCYKGMATTKFGDWFMYDLGLATQNLCLAAHSLGLGTVIVGLFDHDRAKTVLHVPEGYEVVTLIPVGVPAKIGSPPSRKAIAEFTHSDVFHNPYER
jgi:nitroreductase